MILRFDEQGFGTEARKIRWDELLAVGIRTTADGPFLEDVYWQFLTRGGALELPGSLVDGEALRTMQEKLVGIDSHKIILAMGSTRERIFRIWHAEESRHRWDDATSRARFAALVERLGGAASRANAAFTRLCAAWSGDDRRYHDLEHLGDCLRELDGARVDQRLADIVELAIWYHDAIYEPCSSDSEERSATLLEGDARSLEIRGERALAAAKCVRATAHLAGAAPSDPATDLIVDIDLSILGRDVLRFMEFEYAVAEEYAAVSRASYFLARGRFLAGLLASPSIFRKQHFRGRYEERARANIAALLDSPRYGLPRRLGRIQSCLQRILTLVLPPLSR
jgi:predicted metal-dependent HD superfamily phosphohydrolase